MPRGRAPRNPNYISQEEVLGQLGRLPLEQVRAVISEILVIKGHGEIRFYQTAKYVGVTLNGRVLLRLYSDWLDWSELAPSYARGRHHVGADLDARSGWTYYRDLVRRRDDGAA